MQRARPGRTSADSPKQASAQAVQAWEQLVRALIASASCFRSTVISTGLVSSIRAAYVMATSLVSRLVASRLAYPRLASAIRQRPDGSAGSTTLCRECCYCRRDRRSARALDMPSRQSPASRPIWVVTTRRPGGTVSDRCATSWCRPRNETLISSVAAALRRLVFRYTGMPPEVLRRTAPDRLTTLDPGQPARATQG